MINQLNNIKTHFKRNKKIIIVIIIVSLLGIIGMMILIFFTINRSIIYPSSNNSIDTQSQTPPTSDISDINDISFGIAAGSGLTSLSENELEIYFKQLNELGIAWIRWDFDWSEIQPNNKSIYRWTSTDRVAEIALKKNIKSLGIITYTPRWARHSTCINSDKCKPADPTIFGNFAGRVATRYKSKGINHWEIWNEPNSINFFEPTPNVASYSTMLKSAYIAIKKSNPDAFVLSGGLAPTSNVENNISPESFINILYEKRANNYFDAIALHPYSFPAEPSYPASWNGWQQINLIRQIMTENGDNDKFIWFTEFGSPTNGPGVANDNLRLGNFVHEIDFVTENRQSAIANDAIKQSVNMKDWIGPFFWYSLIDSGTAKETPENFFGLLRSDGSKKPAWYIIESRIKNDN